MKLRVKRILKTLIPVPIMILVICIAYLLQPLIHGNGEKDQEKGSGAAAGDATEVMQVQSGSDSVAGVEMLFSPETAPAEEAEELPPDLEQESEPETEPPEKAEEEAAVTLSAEPLALCDLYAERGARVTFQCFYSGAEDYRWEYYDMTVRDWSQIEDVQSGVDGLGRQVSFVCLDAADENDGAVLRCRISFPDGEEITETACLYVLEQSVIDVSVADLSMDAEKYAYIHNVPVTVRYADGTEEEITGLSGMHFLERMEKSIEESVSSTGNLIETVTSVITEADYQYSGYGENEVTLRYHPAGLPEKKIDVTAVLTGTDQNPPVISYVDFEHRIGTEISAEVTVTVTAEDDITPYPLLQYAVLPKGQELTEADWCNRSCFKRRFDQNGTWIVYCRDRYGNIGIYEKDIIVGDQEAPEILSVVLEKEGLQTSNTIRVEAADVLSVSYQYSCAETGEDSGFITRNEYEISDNGTWIIRVRDAAGNTASEQLYVSSIDRKSPVINGIFTQAQTTNTEGAEGGTEN
ncbi:MAG: immunoglobulin domain-containing protein [Clostridium sp.]|nr:immunoglobulin domain-containing protein [Clostridium sp.]